MAEHADDFYVGYAATVPPRTARATRRAVALLLLLAVVAPLLLVLARTPLAPASFEYGVTRHFRGTLRATPFPALLVARPGDDNGESAPTTLLLVAPGKHGAASLVRDYDGASVELAGTLVQRGSHVMIEVEPSSIVTLTTREGAAHQPVADLGAVRLRGEIVDTKCHLGVMNPGDGKTHRGCAARCISGGIPPALRVRDADGVHDSLYLLVGTHGEPIGSALLPLVAEPVEVVGRAERRGDLLVLYAAPEAVRRLGEEG